MKMKMFQEDFISRNIKEFHGIDYCAHCLEPHEDVKPTFCCGTNEFIQFQDLDKETQRNIIKEELRRYA